MGTVFLGNVKGPKGDPGEKGAPGPQGAPGPPGPSGEANSNAPVEFTEATERVNLVSGDAIGVLFGKSKKFFADLKPVAFSGSYVDLVDKPFIPSTPEDIGAVGKDDLATVAMSGSYNDLKDKPSVPDSLPASNVTSDYSPTGVDPVNGTAVNAALKTLDAEEKGGAGKYIQSISEADGKIVAAEAVMPTSLPANGGNADTVGEKNLDYIMDYNNLANKPDAPTAESLGLVSTRSEATLSTSWTGTGAPYSQTVAVSGVASDSIVDIDVSKDVTAEQLDAYINAKIVDDGQSANSITLKAFGEKPTIEIPIKIVVRGS